MPETFELPIVTRDEARASGAVQYFTGVACVNGHVAPRKTETSRCVVCVRRGATTRLERKYKAAPDEFRAYRRRLQAKDPLGELLRRAKSRARKRGYEFSIGRADLHLSEFCPCCGNRMEVRLEALGAGNAYKHCPTIDRLNSNLGYVPGNVNIICWRCNEVKKNATAAELRAVANWINSVTRPVLIRCAA